MFIISPNLKLSVGISPDAGFTTFNVSLTVRNTISFISLEPLDLTIWAFSTVPSFFTNSATFIWFEYAYSVASNKSLDSVNLILLPATCKYLFTPSL